MAVNRFAFDPVSGFLDDSAYPDPKDETETREQLMTPHNQVKDYLNNTVYPTLLLIDTIAQGDVAEIVDAVLGVTKSFTLSAANWVDGVYTITDENITATSNQRLSVSGLSDAEYNAIVGATLADGGQDAGHLYLKAMGTVPTIDIPVSIQFHGEAEA